MAKIRLSSCQITLIKQSLQSRINADASYVPKYKIEDLVEEILNTVMERDLQWLINTPQTPREQRNVSVW